jgi:hypothetical protein
MATEDFESMALGFNLDCCGSVNVLAGKKHIIISA